MLIKRIAGRLLYKELGYIPRNKPYVFGIGLSKTGTTTLNEALGDLGYRAFHQPPLARTDVASGNFALDWPWWMSGYDAATDLTIAALFNDLHTMFPNARFIYTWRDREKWLDSCQRHFTEARKERKKVQPPSPMRPCRVCFMAPKPLTAIFSSRLMSGTKPRYTLHSRPTRVF